MFKKSIIAVAVFGAATFSAQAAFNLPYEHSQQQNNQWTAASQKVDKNFEAVKNEFDKINNALNSTPNQYDAQRWDDGITANKDQIAANKGQIAANKDQIKNNTNDIHDLQQKAVENALHDKNQDQNIGVNANNIEKNQQAIAANKDQIKNNTNDIHGLQQQAVENALHDKNQDQNIGVNANNIEKNQQAIAANYKEMKNNFAAVNSRIDDLDEEMKKGFASQAALAGLFQPYNVGKFNLSVALGGYESEQAMALGTGYRFNENFAMKAGIATDVGGFDHLTYNIGANFEW